MRILTSKGMGSTVKRLGISPDSCRRRLATLLGDLGLLPPHFAELVSITILVKHHET